MILSKLIKGGRTTLHMAKKPKMKEEDSVVNNEVPASRMQGDQAFPKAAEAEETVTPKSGFSKKTVKASGGKLKQEVAASVLNDNADYGGAPGTSAVNAVSRSGLKSMSYSGDAGTIIGSAANTPVAGTRDRADTRFGKKLDETNKKINYLASEQILVEYDNPKPLGEVADQPQGYPGTPKNTSVRSQKTGGFTNAELLFDRSVDELSRDEMIFVSGQVVKEAGTNYMDTPTETEYYDEDDGSIKAKPITLTRGNYIPREIVIKFKGANGSAYVSEFTPVVDDVSCNAENTNVVNHASTNEIVDMNNAEIARQVIDSKAGRETMPNWNPLGRAVRQPTQTVAYLRDIDNELGAYALTSLRFAQKAFSYQLNKAAKDGQRVTAPMREMFYRHIANAKTSNVFEDGQTYGQLFNVNAMKAGSADLMIAVFDSKAKYQTKADVLTQPRSLKMHFATALNNIDFLRVKPEFAKALDSRDVFSTIDREYDPMAPVCITDAVQLITHHNWAAQFAFTRSGINAQRTWQSELFSYFYSDRSSNYLIKVTNPLLAGIAYFFEQHAAKIFSELGGTGNAEVTLHLPVRSTTKAFSLWDFVVMAAMPYIQYERTNALKDVLDFEVNFGYPFAELINLKDVKDAPRSNYVFTAISEPLQTRVMKPSTAITWIMPELFNIPGQRDTTAVGDERDLIVHPWYFAETMYQFNGAPTGSTTNAKLADHCGSMLLPVIRSGVRLSLLDDVYGFDERSLRLALDKMVRSPLDNGTAQVQAAVYKYSQNAEGILCLLKADTSRKDFDARLFISTPRELGWTCVAPGAYVTPIFYATDADYRAYSSYTANHFDVISIAPYKATVYSAPRKEGSAVPTDALMADSVLVNRGQAFAQDWIDVASADETLYPQGANNVNGLSFYSVLANGVEEISAFTTGYATSNAAEGKNAQPKLAGADKLKQFNRLLWARVQKLPFVINPFDCAQIDVGCDVYDLAYLFNMAGFMVSDYEEDINNRIAMIQNAGWLYNHDPFIDNSYLNK